MSEQEADWAILVYISADRVLTNFAVESLKQLKRAAGNGIVALAQMQGSTEKEAQRYVFRGRDKHHDANPNATIRVNREKEIKPAPSPGGIADPRNLTRFIKWASKYKARHRCLFLWGHGYELLLNSDATSSVTNSIQPARNGDRNYLAPKSLKEALKAANASTGKLDIIGVDACSLSLLELASELRGCGDFMVASQGDVPDGSFPYEQLLLTLKRDLNRKGHDRGDVEAICAAIPKLYGNAYQDYVVGPETGISEITLTSLKLNNTGRIEDSLKLLANALLASRFDPSVRKKVLASRKAARDFALGLFVDLRDFCLTLSKAAGEGELKAACDAVIAAIDGKEKQDCILANETRGTKSKQCCGLSVYFPYLSNKEMGQAEQSLAASATTMVDQVELLVKGGTNNLLKARSVQISQIEEDFESLKRFGKATGWSNFIRCGWSAIMAAEEPQELDQHYSGEQCAENLLSLLNQKGKRKRSAQTLPPPPLAAAAKA
jgi:hypothetical protein